VLSGLADIEAAALTMAGGVPGPAVHATSAAVGLSTLLLASATAFTAMKIAGARARHGVGAQGRSPALADPDGLAWPRPDDRAGEWPMRNAAIPRIQHVETDWIEIIGGRCVSIGARWRAFGPLPCAVPGRFLEVTGGRSFSEQRA
jgi:hypothetical protein